MNKMSRKSNIVFISVLTLVCIGLLLKPPSTRAIAYNPTTTPIPVQQTDTTVAVVLSKLQANPGDTFDITVTLTTDAETKGAQFELAFDPSKVEVTSVDTGTFYSDYAKSYGGDAEAYTMPKPAVDNEKGLMPVTAFYLVGVNEPKGPTGTGSLAIIHAKVKDGAKGEVRFSLSTIEVTDTGAGGKPIGLGGVKIQEAILTIGGSAAAEQPAAVLYVKATPKAIVNDQSVQPTAVLRSVPTQSQSGSESPKSAALPIGIILPVGGGVLVIAAAGVILTSKKNKPK